MNYYEILGVSTNATLDEIKAAYRNLIKAFHPDYYKGNKDFAQKKTVEVNEAYEVLKDAEKRYEYDSQNNFWKEKQEHDYSEELNEANRRAEEAEKARKAAETKAEEEKKKREEADALRKQQEQKQFRSTGQSDASVKGGKLTSLLLNFAAVLVGIVIYLLVDLICTMVIGLLSQVLGSLPIISLILGPFLFYNGYSGKFFFVTKAMISTLASCGVSVKIIDFSDSKRYWGTCIIFILMSLLNYNMYANGTQGLYSFLATLGLYLYVIYHAFTKDI